MRSHLNSDLLSNTNFHGLGFIIIYVVLNNCIILIDYLSIYWSLSPVTSSRSYVSILKISDQPIAGSIIIIQERITLFPMIVPPGFCCLIYLLYVPISYTCTESHGFSSAMFLGGRCP